MRLLFQILELLFAKKYAPRLTIHLSTQANTTNWLAPASERRRNCPIVLSRSLALAKLKLLPIETQIWKLKLCAWCNVYV